MEKEKRKKILFIIPSLSGGGAERTIINLIKHIDRNMFVPSLYLFTKKGVFLEQIPDDVSLYYFTDKKKKKNIIDIFRLAVHLAFKIFPKLKPDIVIGTLVDANLIAVIAQKISFIKPAVIITEQNYCSLRQKSDRFSSIKNFLIKRFYNYAHMIISVARGVATDLKDTYNVPADKTIVIYNSIDLESIEKLLKEHIDNFPFLKQSIPVIISCGRLMEQKNYALLLKAFAKVRETIESKLVILGEGEEKYSLVKIADDLNIADDVFFLGFKQNPFKYMAHADVFVLSSLYEGFGNVIIEAMASGVPVISTQAPTGPEEIITNGIDGILVPVNDVKALADSIQSVLTSDTLKKQLTKAGTKRAQDFSVQKMVNQYENVFKLYI
jgi:glycosyltransferase involved in cell wall biosynthesis